MIQNKRTYVADKIKVLIVDDDPLFRKALTKYIHQNEDLTVIGEANDLRTALHAVSKSKPDIVLIDILGFEGNEGGIQIIKKIKVQYKTLPLLAISFHDSSLYAETALDAGARGYLMKGEAAEKIGKVIGQTMGGEIYVSGESGSKIIMRHMKSKLELKQYKLNLEMA